MRRRVFRAVNERIAELASRGPDAELELICECADAECIGRIMIVRRDYERVSRLPRGVLLLPGHENGDDTVVERGAAYLVVEPPPSAAEPPSESAPSAPSPSPHPAR